MLINKMYNWLKTFAKPKYLLSGFIIILLFNLVFFPFFPRLFSGEVTNLNILDTRLFYTLSDVNTTFNEMGALGRKIYLLSTIVIDIPYLLFYSVLYASVLVFLVDRLAIPKLSFIIFAPLLLGLFDLLENTGVIYLLLRFPDISEIQVNIASTFTTLKWLFALLTFVLTLALFIGYLVKMKR